jgi:crossover junction endodeoxyribonuclease RusA
MIHPSTLQGVLLRATLPLPPGINASYKTGNGKFYGSSELKQFKEEAHYVLVACGFNNPVIDEIKASKRKVPLTLQIDFFFETLYKRDVDGGVKAVQDAVFQPIGLNDNLVKRLIVEKHADRDNPRCEVSLSCY